MVVSLVQWKISYIDYNIKDIKIKTVGLIENGSWAPLANKVMKDMLTPMKNITICENTVTIKSTYKDENQEAINQLG